MQMILFTGIPGSGKSTFYKEYFFHTHLRVNLDMLRTRNRENRLLNFCFQTSMPLVVDNTNVTIADRKKYIDLAREYRYTVTGYYFEASLQSCLERNTGRSGRQQVPERGILAKYKALQIPLLEEGYADLYYVKLQADNGFFIKPFPHEIQ
jgi:predicted kinase